MDAICKEWLRLDEVTNTEQAGSTTKGAFKLLSIYLLDRSADMVAAWQDAFEGATYFQVKNPPSKIDWDYARPRRLPDMDR